MIATRRSAQGPEQSAARAESLVTPLVTPLAADVFDRLELGTPPAAEVRRHLGYSAGAVPRAALAAGIDAALADAAALLEPRGAFAVHAATVRGPRSLEVAGRLIRGEIGRFLGPVDRVAVVVATAGAAVSELSERRARDGDPLGAWVADALGSWAAEAAADAVTDRLQLAVGAAAALTLRYSPGYCGIAIARQRELFRLVDAAAAGVELLPSLVMRPVKSVSGIVGIGPAGALPVAPRSPCEVCGRQGCHMRR